MQKKKTEKVHDSGAEAQGKHRFSDPAHTVKPEGHFAGKRKQGGCGGKELAGQKSPEITCNAKARDGIPDKQDTQQQGEGVLPEGGDCLSHAVLDAGEGCAKVEKGADQARIKINCPAISL